MTAERFFLSLGIALCLFSLWAIGRHDLLRLIRPTRRGIARVAGHRTGWDEGHRNYAAIYAFSDEGGDHEVTDPVYAPAPRPPVGSMVELAWPEGRPDLARPPRPVMWALVYLCLAGTAGLLGAKWLGLIAG